MCLVIDTCCIPPVFDRNNQNHPTFAPILEWITRGNGRMIYGGTKYNEELGRAARYLRFVGELNRKGRTIQMPKQDVDAIAEKLKERIRHPAFNDEHLVALVIASRCCVVCTNDTTAIMYLRRPDLYTADKVRRPKIYRYRSHRNMCCDANLAPICRRGN